MPPPFNGGTNAGEILSADTVGGGGGADPMAGLGGLTIEELLQYLMASQGQSDTPVELTGDQIGRHFTPFQDKDKILQEQIQQATALRNQPQPQHSTGLGAAFGGLANAVNIGSSHLQEHGLRGQQEQLLGLKQADAADLAAATQTQQMAGQKEQLQIQKLLAEALRRRPPAGEGLAPMDDYGM